MKSFQNLREFPAGVPLLSDSIAEFHAARLLMLLLVCGRSGRIDGLTKLAKLDFFVRYPDFFWQLVEPGHATRREGGRAPESPMVRHHYGPWDKRYYQIIAHLESKGLLQIERKRNAFSFSLTRLGKDIASKIGDDPAFADLRKQMEVVQELLGDKKGSELKKLIYDQFDSEVARLPMGQVIRR